MGKRSELIDKFLDQSGWGAAVRKPLAGDASARAYERLTHNGATAVLMNADPAKGESVEAFITMTRHLRSMGLSAPQIFASSEQDGLLLLEDLGDDLFARHVQSAPQDEATLYLSATDVLASLHLAPLPEVISDYRQDMTEMAGLAYDWYADSKVISQDTRAEFNDEVSKAVSSLTTQPGVLILRDYHAENLLWLPLRQGLARVGLLDYQDAMIGPRAYDLMSLVKDARRDVGPDVVTACIERYLEVSGIDRDAFAFECAACSAQRNLRILGVFARLSLRDNKPGYLKWLPRVWRHLMDDLSHPDLWALRNVVLRDLPAPDAKTQQRLMTA